MRNKYLIIPADEYYGLLAYQYERIKALGKKEGIEWSEIEFKGFTHEIEEYRDIKYIKGFLKFAFGDKEHEMLTLSLWTGQKYVFDSIWQE